MWEVGVGVELLDLNLLSTTQGYLTTNKHCVQAHRGNPFTSGQEKSEEDGPAWGLLVFRRQREREG